MARPGTRNAARPAIRELRLRPAARADLDGIWKRGAERWSVAQADAYLRSLGATFQLLREFPELAHERTEIVPPVRVHPHRAHLIVYRVTEVAVEVIRVLYSRQDWHTLLRE